MEISQDALESLFDTVCNRARVSVSQSNEAILRQSRKRLSANPSDAAALHVIAASSLVRGEPKHSLEVLQRSAQEIESDPTGNRLAGYAWLASQDVARARKCFDDSVRLDPHQADCWNRLGQIAEWNDDHESAMGYYERGILFDDGQHDSAIALSDLQLRNRKVKDAIHTLRICLLRDRRSPKLNLALARILERRIVVMGRRGRRRVQQRLREEALQCYVTINAVAPESQTLVAQGRMQQQMFDHEGARDSFEKAVALDPESAGAISHLACANVDFGDIENAIDQFQRSIAIDPSRAETHFRYTRSKRFQANADSDKYVRQLQKQLSLADQSAHRVHYASQKIHFNFALAKVFDDRGDYDQAWKHYDRANRTKAGEPHSQDKHPPTKVQRHPPFRDMVGATMDFFTPDFFERHREIGNSSRAPIFIIGMPRSGTTLTEQIVSSHPEVAGAGELMYIDQIRQEILRENTTAGGGRAPDARLYPGVLEKAQGTDLLRHADFYLQQLDRFRTSQLRVTDKMPTNFLHLGLIAMLFPGATVIHCRRHPMDVLVSCYCQNLNTPFCDLEQMVDYHRHYRRLMAHWQRVLPIKIHTNDYESLVNDPEVHTREMIRHCGLDWSDDCLQFQSNNRAVHTPSKWQVRQPMYRSSVEKWRRFEKHLAPVAERIASEMDAESKLQFSSSI
jgi:tetratricopeptide (TPR) repeat protein